MWNGFVMESLEVKLRKGFVLWYGVGLLNGIIHLLGWELIFFVTFSNTDRKGRKKPPCRFAAYRAKQSPCYTQSVYWTCLKCLSGRQFFQFILTEEVTESTRVLFWLRADIELMLMNWQFSFFLENSLCLIFYKTAAAQIIKTPSRPNSWEALFKDNLKMICHYWIIYFREGTSV